MARAVLSLVINKREHLRCPVCGKVSRGTAFGVVHRLQVLTQHFVGRHRGTNRGGFIWTRRDAERPLLESLEKVVRQALEGLRAQLGLPRLVPESQVVEPAVRMATLRPSLHSRTVSIAARTTVPVVARTTVPVAARTALRPVVHRGG